MSTTRKRIKGRTGEYQLLHQIATGRRFAVHLAIKEGETGPGRFAVVKEILSNLSQDKPTLSRFMKEA